MGVNVIQRLTIILSALLSILLSLYSSSLCGVTQPQKSEPRALLPIQQNGKWGYIDKTGRVVIPLQHDSASEFSEGLACVSSGKKYGYIDRAGRMVIEPQFSSCGRFSDGLARVRVGGKYYPPMGVMMVTSGSSGKVRFIDKTGRVVIKPHVESAEDFSEGLSAFEVKKTDGYLYCGYMDGSGKAVIPPQFGHCDSFSEGLAAVLLNGTWRYIDKTGATALTAPFALVWEFRDGLAEVQLGGLDPFQEPKAKYGYINRRGKVVWQPIS